MPPVALAQPGGLRSNVEGAARGVGGEQVERALLITVHLPDMGVARQPAQLLIESLKQGASPGKSLGGMLRSRPQTVHGELVVIGVAINGKGRIGGPRKPPFWPGVV